MRTRSGFGAALDREAASTRQTPEKIALESLEESDMCLMAEMTPQNRAEFKAFEY